MSSLLEQRGINPDEIRWEDLALCRGLPTSFFFETYETDKIAAKAADEMCLRCPVMKICAMQALNSGEYGLWGGIYWSAGSKDNYKNAHKTPAVWKRINEVLTHG